MQITKLTPQIKNPARVNVYVDGEFYRGLDRLVAVKLGLRPGLVLTPSLVDRLEQSQTENSGWEWALKTLQISPRSEREMAQKLKRKFEPELAVTLLKRLKQAGLLDDQKLAEHLLQRWGREESKSRRELKLKLQHKGIPNQIVQTVTLPANEAAAALKLAARKNQSLVSKLLWSDRRIKIAGYLARKGFNYPIIQQVLKELADRDVEETT